MQADAWKAFIDSDPVCKQICSAQGLKEHQLFERACAVRLCQAIVQHGNRREPGCFSYGVMPNTPSEPITLSIEYKSVACATCAVDQAPLEAGPADRGLKHFWGSPGRMRPDITLILCPPTHPSTSAICCECRCQNNRQDALEGYYRAALYRSEFGSMLKCSPKAALVTVYAVDGEYDGQHDVLACSWQAWPAPQLVDACGAEMRRNFHAAAQRRRRA